MLLQQKLGRRLASIVLVDDVLQIVNGRMLQLDGEQAGIVVDALVLVAFHLRRLRALPQKPRPAAQGGEPRAHVHVGAVVAQRATHLAQHGVVGRSRAVVVAALLVDGASGLLLHLAHLGRQSADLLAARIVHRLARAGQAHPVVSDGQAQSRVVLGVFVGGQHGLQLAQGTFQHPDGSARQLLFVGSFRRTRREQRQQPIG